MALTPDQFHHSSSGCSKQTANQEAGSVSRCHWSQESENRWRETDRRVVRHCRSSRGNERRAGEITCHQRDFAVRQWMSSSCSGEVLFVGLFANSLFVVVFPSFFLIFILFSPVRLCINNNTSNNNNSNDYSIDGPV